MQATILERNSVVTFPRFPNLPTELRVAIWRSALLQPRLITIRNFSLYERHVLTENLYIHPCDPPPPLTQACSESRKEALLVHTRAFTSGYEPRYTYVNFFLDTIAIPDYDIRHLSREERFAIQYLLITMEEREAFMETVMWEDGSVGELENLNELTVVGIDWGGDDPHDIAGYYANLLKDDLTGIHGQKKGWSCPKIKFVGEDDGGSYDVKVLSGGSDFCISR